MSLKDNALTNRKGQITVFVAVGIMVLAAFGMIIAVSGPALEQHEQKASRLAAETMQAAAIEEHIKSCVERSLGEALETLGRQGGFIFKEQEGSIVSWEPKAFIYPESNNKVAYQIFRDTSRPVPSYPCLSAIGAPRYCEFVHDAARLSLQQGPLYSYTYGAIKPFFLYTASAPFAIQRQLESHVNALFKECIHFQNFKDKGFAIAEAAEPVTNISITENAVSAAVTFPITITVEGKVPVIQRFKFTVKKDVKLKQLYEAVVEVISKDNNYLLFDITTDSLQGVDPVTKQELKLKKLSPLVTVAYSVNGFDDLIKITDTTSKLDGRAYSFWFMRENRPPVLDLVEGEVQLDPNYDFVVGVGDELVFKPVAHDPDEDRIIYSYDGWKKDELQDSLLWNTPGDCFHRCASYTTTENDVNEHEIIVKASDGQYADYQKVRVKVVQDFLPFAFPRLPFNGASYLASLEDPLFLDASASTLLSSPGVSYLYLWSDLTANKILQSTPHKCVILQTGEQCDDAQRIDIKTIKDNALLPVGRHDITLTIQARTSSGVQSRSASVPVEVKKCIPYEPQLPPYPFNYPQNPIDAFLGRHSCCNDDGTYKPSTDVCFEEELGPTCFPADNAQKQRATEKIITSSPIQLPNQDFHNIYEISAKQMCSGNRGNICDGTLEKYEFVLKEDCTAGGKHQSCVGPCNPSNPECSINTCPFNDKNKLYTGVSCYNYGPGQTFEKDFMKQSNADGTCDSQKKRCGYDPAGQLVLSNTGNLACVSQCDGSGGCTYPVLASPKCATWSQCNPDNFAVNNPLKPHNCALVRNCADGTTAGLTACNANCQCEYDRSC